MLKQWLGPDWMRQLTPLATLIVLVLAVGSSQPRFLDPETLLVLASDTAVLFLLAVGVAFVIMVGGIDLSIQSVASLASVIVALVLLFPGGVGGLVARIARRPA